MATLAVAAAAAWPATAARPAFVSVHGAVGRPLLVLGVGFGEAYALTSNVPLGMRRAWTVAAYRPPVADVATHRSLLGPTLDVRHGRGGFYVGRADHVAGMTGATTYVAAAPLWAVATALAIVPSAAVVRWWRRDRTPAGHCRRCGYDLRATPDRCPECGAAA